MRQLQKKMKNNIEAHKDSTTEQTQKEWIEKDNIYKRIEYSRHNENKYEKGNSLRKLDSNQTIKTSSQFSSQNSVISKVIHNIWGVSCQT